MSLKLFITGTDTAVGKTYITLGILNFFKQQNLSTLGLKPVSSGCSNKNGEWVNEDVELIKAHSTIQLPYNQINPFAFEPPIAPHIAATCANQELSVAKIIHRMQTALQSPADTCIIEGVGGWYCPLNTKQTMADLVRTMQFKTILVVGIRLGCLNHALLTYKAILKDHVPFVGWVANCLDPNMLHTEENIAALKEMLAVPCLGTINYKSPPEKYLTFQHADLS